MTPAAEIVESPRCDGLTPAHSPGILRTVFSFPVTLGAALAAMAFFLANRDIGDPDIWWHLRNAEYLVKTHHFVRFDSYSFSTPGVPWINHEWLAELPYYFAFHWLGFRGLFLIFVVCLEIVLLGVFCLATSQSRNVKAAFLSSWVCVYLATVSFGPRTLLFGWILLVTELAILFNFQQGRDYTWWLPPLFLVWVNAHGSWLIGMVLLVTFVLCGCVQGAWGRIRSRRWSIGQLRKLAAVTGLSLLALFGNPYGYRLVFYPFNLAFRQKLNVGHVQEWQSLDFHSLRGKIMIAILAATILLALARKTRWSLWSLALLLIGYYSALTYMRFLFLAGILFTPLLATEINRIQGYRRSQDKPFLNAMVMAGLLCAVLWQFPSEAKLAGGIAGDYPVQALSYLQTFKPGGPVLNDYDWGGYLVWNVRQIPVFVDSRVDIYEYCGVFADYLQIMGLQQSLELMDKHHIRYVLFATKAPLSYLLRRNPGWKVLYQDPVATVFARTAP